jgi:copper(I)-binding protein
LLLSTSVAIAILAACEPEPLAPLVVSNVEIVAPVPGQTVRAAYLTLQNNSKQAIVISRVTSTEFESVEVHDSRVENGIAKMRKLLSLTIPAGGAVVLERGGKHLMLSRPTKLSDSVSLSFYTGATLLLNLTTTVTPRTD